MSDRVLQQISGEKNRLSKIITIHFLLEVKEIIVFCLSPVLSSFH